MQQPCVIAPADEFSHVDGGVYIRRKRISQVRIEVGEPGAVDDQIKVRAQPRGNVSIDSQPGLSHIALDHFNLFVDELQELRSVFLVKWIEYGRFFSQLLKALLL